MNNQPISFLISLLAGEHALTSRNHYIDELELPLVQAPSQSSDPATKVSMAIEVDFSLNASSALSITAKQICFQVNVNLLFFL